MKRILLIGMFAVLMFSCSEKNNTLNIPQENLLNGVKNIYSFPSDGQNFFDINNSNDDTYISSFIESSLNYYTSLQLSFNYDLEGKLSEFTYNFTNLKNHVYEDISYDTEGKIISFQHKIYDLTNNSLIKDVFENITYTNNVVLWETSDSQFTKIEFSGNKISKWGHLYSNGEYANHYLAPIYTYNYNGSNVSIARSNYIDIYEIQRNDTSFKVNEVVIDDELKNPLFLVTYYRPEMIEFEILLNVRLLRDIPSEISIHFAEAGVYSLKNIIRFNDFDFLLIYSHIYSNSERYVVYDY